MDLKTTIKDSLVNLRGWRTRDKVIVFESDDWGSIRMRDAEALQALKDYGLPTDKCPYLSNDRLENGDDLRMLTEVLARHKDKTGRPAAFTLNTIMANPDFDRIGRGGYQQYCWEHFHDTYQRYGYDVASMKSAWQVGMAGLTFRPQFHGREHVQVSRWMNSLKNGSQESRLAFDLGILGISTTVTGEKRASYLPAFDFDSKHELESQKQIITEGLNLFERTFGFPSASFIAPNYTWSTSLEPHLASAGVRYIQGARAQREPLGNGATQVKRRFMGQKNGHGQRYFIRNVQFEPSFNKHYDWVGNALRQIGIAFTWKKPAIITTHRVNFVGGISAENRARNLALLDKLLSELLKRHRDVRFMFSDELGFSMDNIKPDVR